MVKLNLGCGNKLYPANEGWVNVDIVEPKLPCNITGTVGFGSLLEKDEEVPWFHQSDLKVLKWVDTDFADEIHGYHIIEHFYRDEVPGVLTEWLRVLKPGGMIVLEAPDVIKCAANLLSGYHRGDWNFAHHLGILGFYGDGTPDQPYMGHHWGWTAQTIGHQLAKVGFVNIQEQPPQTHRKDERDFRIVGYKPTV